MNDTKLSGDFVRAAEAQTPGTTSKEKMDEVIGRLLDGAKKFSALSLRERIALARSMQSGYARVAENSVKATCAAKGNPLERHGAIDLRMSEGKEPPEPFAQIQRLDDAQSNSPNCAYDDNQQRRCTPGRK